MKCVKADKVAFIQAGRSPCGERGLKWLMVTCPSACWMSLPVRGAWVEISVCLSVRSVNFVAPRAGSVG